MNNTKYLKEREVAQIIRKSTAWLQRSRWQGGGIPYHKIGRSVVYFELDVMQWLEDNAPKFTSTSQYKPRND